MGQETSQVIITGDVSAAEAALASIGASAKAAAADVDTIGDSFAQVENEAESAARATDQVAAAIDKETAAVEKLTKEEREAAAVAKQASLERVEGFERAAAHAKRYAAQLQQVKAEAREGSAAVQKMAAARQGFAGMAGSIGSVVTGLQSAIALAHQAIALGDEIADRSLTAQNLAANLAFPIDAAAAATQGFVTQTDLAAQANKAFALGVSESSEDFAKLAAGISAIARKSGGDVTKLLEQAVEAVGKGSVERLDNVLVLLTQTEAEREYADSVGVTVDELSALQKANAIQEVALRRIEAQTDSTAAAAAGLAERWKQGRVNLEDFVDEALGFDQTAARVAEALRALSEEELGRLDFAEFAGEGLAISGEVNKFLSEWGVSLQDVKATADELGIGYGELIDRAREQIAGKAAKQEERRLQGVAMQLREQAVQSEHIGDLLSAQGADYSAISIQIQDGIRLRIEAAEAEGEIAKAAALTRSLQVEQAKAMTEADKPAKSRGRRRDPNEQLDRNTAALIANLDARQQVAAAELDFVRDLDLRAAKEFELIEMEREALRIRQEAADQRKVRGADQIAERELELLSITTEARLLDLDVQRIIEEEEQGRSEARLSGMDREIERLQALGVQTQLLEQQRQEAALEFAANFGTAEEIADAQHEAEIIRIEDLRARRIEIAQEELDAFNREAELMAARGEQVSHLAEQRIELEARVSAAERDSDKVRASLHKKEVARIQEQVRRRKQALSNANSFLSQGQQFANTIVNAAIKDDARREKAALRVRGVEALAIGALQTVEAVAAFASFNVVQGALHTAAAAVAFTQGALMISGQVPSAGGAAGGGGGGGGQRETFIPEGQQRAARDLPSTPASAEELTRISGGGEVASTDVGQGAANGGNVVHISGSTIVTGDTGGLLRDLEDRQTQKAWGAN